MEDISKTNIAEPALQSADTGENSVSVICDFKPVLQYWIFVGKWTK